MQFNELNEDNFLLFAIKHYDNPQSVTIEDFYEDLKRFKYLKRLLNRYLKGGTLRIHLILNHIIVIYNQFGQEAGTRLLFLKLDDYYAELLPFLLFLNRVPELVYQIGLPPQNIKTDYIKPDIRVVEILNKELRYES